MSISEMIISLPPILWALTVHEFSHAYVATKLGDPTPKLQGRLTMNPISHIDILGFIALFLVHFGWAKPVMINPLYFRNVDIRLGSLLVAIAGPVANIASAFVSLIILNHLPNIQGAIREPIIYMLNVNVIINVAFAVFNMLPVPPLDGYKVAEYFFPRNLLPTLRRIEPYGPFILIFLVITPILGYILMPLVNGIIKLMMYIVI